MSLTGSVVLITGGAGGIGAASARLLAERGAVPVLADLDPAALERVAATLPGEPLTAVVDVTDRASCAAAVEAVMHRYGRLDVVWANAGIAAFGPLELAAPEVWQRVVDVNLIGAYNTIHAALRAVIAARGYVAVTASVASFAHVPGQSAYAASKAGVEALANALRIEVADQGVAVGTFHPGWVDTELVREKAEGSPAYRRLRAAMRPPFKATVPVERVARDLVRAIERRSARVCTPPSMRLAHVLRAAAPTRPFTRELRSAAPEIRALFAEQASCEGAALAGGGPRLQPHLTTTNVRGTPE